jgi:DNA-binding transcriptional regulator YiaG
MEEIAHITPTVIKWARKSARMSRQATAAELSIPLTELQSWENGTSRPTIKEAQNLAKLYKRPFAIFFLPEIPKGFRVLKDF